MAMVTPTPSPMLVAVLRLDADCPTGEAMVLVPEALVQFQQFLSLPITVLKVMLLNPPRIVPLVSAYCSMK